jgi:hypothetical protein
MNIRREQNIHIRSMGRVNSSYLNESSYLPQNDLSVLRPCFFLPSMTLIALVHFLFYGRYMVNTAREKLIVTNNAGLNVDSSSTRT